MRRRRPGTTKPYRAGRRRLRRPGPLGGGTIIVVAVVALVAFAGGRLEPPPGDAVAGPAGTTGGHVAAGGQAPTATTTTDPDAGLPPHDPTAGAPLRVLEIGDSLGIDLGFVLQNRLAATGRAQLIMASLGDTGLANTAYYDWPAQLARLLAADDPRIVVVFLGANDDQGLYVDGAAAAPGSAAWAAGYRQRVKSILGEAIGVGVRVVWVGMPPMADPVLDAQMIREDAVFADETARVAGALYVSATAVLGTGAGAYQSTGSEGPDQGETLRTPDGVHLTPAGAGVLADAVIAAVEARWHVSLDDPAPNTPPSEVTVSAPEQGV